MREAITTSALGGVVVNVAAGCYSTKESVNQSRVGKYRIALYIFFLHHFYVLATFFVAWQLKRKEEK